MHMHCTESREPFFDCTNDELDAIGLPIQMLQYIVHPLFYERSQIEEFCILT